MIAVLDASALIAVVRRERGFEQVLPFVHDAVLGTVNLAEAIEVLGRFGNPSEFVVSVVEEYGIETAPYSEPHAVLAAELAVTTRGLGLSLGDRSCLAVAMDVGGVAVTANRAWGEVDLGIEVVLIR